MELLSWRAHCLVAPRSEGLGEIIGGDGVKGPWTSGSSQYLEGGSAPSSSRKPNDCHLRFFHLVPLRVLGSLVPVLSESLCRM